MREELIERFLEFAVKIYHLEKPLCKTYTGRHIYGQLFRSGTSAGANYDEATAAESRQDFIHKMQITLKELRESYYWIRLLLRIQLLSDYTPLIETINKENHELMNIIGKGVATAKNNLRK